MTRRHKTGRAGAPAPAPSHRPAAPALARHHAAPAPARHHAAPAPAPRSAAAARARHHARLDAAGAPFPARPCAACRHAAAGTGEAAGGAPATARRRPFPAQRPMTGDPINPISPSNDGDQPPGAGFDAIEKDRSMPTRIDPQQPPAPHDPRRSPAGLGRAPA